MYRHELYKDIFTSNSCIYGKIIPCDRIFWELWTLLSKWLQMCYGGHAFCPIATLCIYLERSVHDLIPKNAILGNNFIIYVVEFDLKFSSTLSLKNTDIHNKIIAVLIL